MKIWTIEKDSDGTDVAVERDVPTRDEKFLAWRDKWWQQARAAMFDVICRGAL